MNRLPALPPTLRPLIAFAGYLRGFGFPVAPEQTLAFVASIGLLGPRHMGDIHAAALATFAPLPERHDEFDALFRAFFFDAALPTSRPSPDSEETHVKDDRPGRIDRLSLANLNEGGDFASALEMLAARSFGAGEPNLARFTRLVPGRLPRRRSFRWRPTRSGTIDLRRSLRAALRHDGDVPVTALHRRASMPRKILLLIDVSGSMKARASDHLRVAHALTQAAERVETFTFGNRLTRVSPALGLKDPGRALDETALCIDDWDGGTRVGEALKAFLAVPRFAAYARGALTIILSDALEQPDPGFMVDAVRRLSRLSWRLAWLTPLAADLRFLPQAAAMRAILPWLDDLGDAGSQESVTRYILGLGRKGK